ncbi:PQQ-binding-like beta-propeller repeat protein [Arachnia propionica]|uniref:outer membrane protein assembly factor BamB family protein n=1 Tax=Arachnia propionica TaxID=1750 RepID=UPI0028F12E8C|nr:PQQ-binding-like beta-propeller repeat protein [Arachnia propionica]
MKAVTHSPNAAARPTSRWRLRGAATLMGAVLLTTSCWGTGSETPSSAPTVPSSPESSPPPTPPAQLTTAWEVTVTGSGPLIGAHEGLVVAPDLATGGSKLRMLNWADGSEVWSVDISGDLTGFERLEKVSDMVSGQVALWAKTSQQRRSLFVYSTADGSLIGRLDEKPEHYLAMAASGAIYEMDTSNEGSVRISRAPSVKEAHTKQWSIDLPEEAREWFWVREHDGVTDFCVDGQAGPIHEYACYLSVHTDDGRPVVQDGVWHRSAWVGNVLVGHKENGPLKGFDQHGKELWTSELQDGYPLGWGDDLVYVTEGTHRSFVGLDPATGKELWRRDWDEGSFPGLVFDRTPSPQDGPLSVFVPSPSIRTGVLDPKTGQVDLVDHQITKAHDVIPTFGGALLIPTGDYYAPTWIALDPGKPGTLWDDVLKNYDTYATLGDRLMASKGDRIALLA